jgi:Fic family protein
LSGISRRHWITEAGSASRRDRRSCEYETYVPNPLVGRPISRDGEVAADVTEAETAIATLDSQGTTLANTEALARILLRAEAVASSRIEGLEVGARRLLRAEVEAQLGEAPSDVTATEVLANIDAMATAVHSIEPGDQVTLSIS